MRTILLLLAVTACSDSPSPCSDDIAALYDRGCTFARADGTPIDEAELRERCDEFIDDAGERCTSRLQEFTACWGGGLAVVCE